MPSLSTTIETITALDLNLHKDTDSPFAIRQTANDNWQEIMEYSVEVKNVIQEIIDNLGQLSPEAIKELIRELLIESKATYIISKDMLNNESVTFPDGTVLVRSNNTYSLSMLNADKRLLNVVDTKDFSAMYPAITLSATEIKLYFDTPIVDNARVLVM